MPDIKIHYEAAAIKTVWYWHENRHINQWNRIESPKINPHFHSQLIFNKGGRCIKWSKNSLFDIGVGRTGMVHAKKKLN